MREDHGVDKADSRCEPCSRQSGYSGEDVGRKEDSAECCRICAETKVKPISDNTLEYKPPAKASKPNNALSFSPSPRDRCSPNRLRKVAWAFFLDTSTAGDNLTKSKTSNTLIAAYPNKVAR